MCLSKFVYPERVIDRPRERPCSRLPSRGISTEQLRNFGVLSDEKQRDAAALDVLYHLDQAITSQGR
jgi:hypothetical protein